MAELVIETGQVHQIEPGAHRLSELEIRKGATLQFSGSTSLLVTNLICEEGAKIEYQSNEMVENGVFSLNCIDASKVEDLTLLGNGKNGKEAAGTAKDGANGRNAKSCKFSDIDGRKARPGEPGHHGKAGSNGEDAIDFTLFLPNAQPGVSLRVQGIGGVGGNGQDGGKGGNGGGRSNCHDGRNGGPGGNGGAAGDGGDAGKIYVFLVVDDDEYESRAKSEARIEAVTFVAETTPGAGGAGGSGGTGGQPGKGAHIGAGAKKSGPDGRRGPDGSNGDGPIAGSTTSSFVKLEVMAQSAHKQFLAQELQSFS